VGDFSTNKTQLEIFFKMRNYIYHEHGGNYEKDKKKTKKWLGYVQRNEVKFFRSEFSVAGNWFNARGFKYELYDLFYESSGLVLKKVILQKILIKKYRKAP